MGVVKLQNSSKKGERRLDPMLCNAYCIVSKSKTKFGKKNVRAYKPYLNYDRGFSFLPFHKANKLTPETFTTLKRTPGISPTLCPDRPNPETRTSSLSSINVRQPSAGTKAVIFLPFLISWTRAHFRIAELGCLASIPNFSTTIPFACEHPPKGSDLNRMPECRFFQSFLAHR